MTVLRLEAPASSIGWRWPMLLADLRQQPLYPLAKAIEFIPVKPPLFAS